MTEKSEAEVGTVLGGLVEQKGGKLEYERPLKQSGIEKVKKIIKPLNFTLTFFAIQNIRSI